MAFHPRSMFLDDAEVHTRSSYSPHRGLDRFSRRKSRSDISSDYEQDRLGLVRTQPGFAHSDYPRPMGILKSPSDFSDYERHDLDYDEGFAGPDYDRERKYRVEYLGDLHNPKLRRRKSFKRSKSK